VYNMTVDEFHTYFVSDLGIWVHNTNAGDCILSSVAPDAYDGYYVRKAQRTEDYNNKTGKWKGVPKTALPNGPYRTDKEAEAAANMLGFEKVNAGRAKAAVFYSKEKGVYITRDIPRQSTGTTDNGGVWKMADSIPGLMSRETRSGTYNKNLMRIGD
ncbi:toxin C-terminal domain-containing protein, partial [Saccharibacillus deserti]|uniref:toxin C-terminal domain-containing protein n=1 Tax=Saccharibacillus deserti TaxID=1634444 RepID=UPI001C12D501